MPITPQELISNLGDLPPPPVEVPVDRGPALAGWGPEGLQTPSLKRKGRG